MKSIVYGTLGAVVCLLLWFNLYQQTLYYGGDPNNEHQVTIKGYLDGLGTTEMLTTRSLAGFIREFISKDIIKIKDNWNDVQKWWANKFNTVCGIILLPVKTVLLGVEFIGLIYNGLVYFISPVS